jgi:hypothetical protein
MGYVTPNLNGDPRGRSPFPAQLHESSSLPYCTLQLENIASIVYCIAIMFAKLSILLLYMKIFVPTRRGGVFWANQVLIYVNALFYFGAVVALICQCIPRAKISNPRLPGRCTDVYLSFMISGVFNVLSDFFILAFPLWAIWHLQMPLKRKFGVSVVFATGVLYVLPFS